MSIKEIVLDRTVQAAPSGAYLTATAIYGYLPMLVSVMTALLVALQIYKAIVDIRAAKRKEKAACKPSDKG